MDGGSSYRWDTIASKAPRLKLILSAPNQPDISLTRWRFHPDEEDGVVEVRFMILIMSGLPTHTTTSAQDPDTLWTKTYGGNGA